MPNLAYITPLEDWIDQEDLRDFIDKHLKVHLEMYGVPEEDLEPLVRLVMISLRQELSGGRTYDSKQQISGSVYKTALKNLIAKLDKIAVDPDFRRVFSLATVHGEGYTGPNWAEEYAAAQWALDDGEGDTE